MGAVIRVRCRAPAREFQWSYTRSCNELVKNRPACSWATRSAAAILKRYNSHARWAAVFIDLSVARLMLRLRGIHGPHLILPSKYLKARAAEVEGIRTVKWESLIPAYLPPANCNTLIRIRSAIRHGLVCPPFPCLIQSTSPGTRRCFSRFTWRALRLNRLAARATVMCPAIAFSITFIRCNPFGSTRSSFRLVESDGISLQLGSDVIPEQLHAPLRFHPPLRYTAVL